MVNSIFSDEQIEMLNTPLTESEIEFRDNIRYLKGQVAVAKANRIFNYGNWGYTYHDMQIRDTGKTTKNGSQIHLVTVSVTLQVRAPLYDKEGNFTGFVEAMPITEIGSCVANGMGDAALDMALKGSVTDALKRCLKNYGAAMGLDLYMPEWKPGDESVTTTVRTDPIDRLDAEVKVVALAYRKADGLDYLAGIDKQALAYVPKISEEHKAILKAEMKASHARLKGGK